MTSMWGCTAKKLALKSYISKTQEEYSLLGVQPHIDVMASLLFVNINGIPVMYAAF